MQRVLADDARRAADEEPSSRSRTRRRAWRARSRAAADRSARIAVGRHLARVLDRDAGLAAHRARGPRAAPSRDTDRRRRRHARLKSAAGPNQSHEGGEAAGVEHHVAIAARRPCRRECPGRNSRSRTGKCPRRSSARPRSRRVGVRHGALERRRVERCRRPGSAADERASDRGRPARPVGSVERRRPRPAAPASRAPRGRSRPRSSSRQDVSLRNPSSSSELGPSRPHATGRRHRSGRIVVIESRRGATIAAARRVPSRRSAARLRLQRLVYTLRTEGASRSREAWAIGLGLFVGCSPFIGLHLGMCVALGWLFGLNRLKLYLAANLVNPLIMPAILVRRSADRIVAAARPWLSAVARRRSRRWTCGSSASTCSLGSVIIGGGARRAGRSCHLRVARPRLSRSRIHAAGARGRRSLSRARRMTAWEFARAKLRNDPVYRAVLLAGWLPAAGRLVDVGCGQGLLLALLAAGARTRGDGGAGPPAWPAPPTRSRSPASSCGRAWRGSRGTRSATTRRSSTGDAREADLGRADVDRPASTCCTSSIAPVAGATSSRGPSRRSRPAGASLVREADAGGRLALSHGAHRQPRDGARAAADGAARSPFARPADWRATVARRRPRRATCSRWARARRSPTCCWWRTSAGGSSGRSEEPSGEAVGTGVAHASRQAARHALRRSGRRPAAPPSTG